jgi:NitT/TauT family transport system substrate-binding protein
VLVGVAAALGVLAAAPSAAQTKIRFQLDWRLDGQTAPFFMGACRGYYKAEGLDVQLDAGAGSSLAVQRVASGTYDMGFGDTSSLIEFVANNIDKPDARLRAVYVTYDASPSGIMTLKKQKIAKPADLVGKTLGAPIFDAGRKLFPLFARAQGIDVNAVKWATMDPKLREQMLAKGEIEAITGFVWSSIVSLDQAGVKDEDVAYFMYQDFGVDVYGNAILAYEKFLKEPPKAVAGFLRAYNKALKDTIANPAEAIKCLKEREPIIDTAVELKRLKAMMDYHVATPNVKKNGLGELDRARFAKQVEDVAAAFGLKAKPDVGILVDMSLLPPAAERRL